MTHEIETQWMGKMQFSALINGHTIMMDAPERVGGKDRIHIRKPFILSALAGSTGMDIVTILRKSGKWVDDFKISVSGEINKQDPVVYTIIHIVYHFKGSEDLKRVALNAVMDSQEKFCGVSQLLKRIMPITWEVNYNGEKIYSNNSVLIDYQNNKQNGV